MNASTPLAVLLFAASVACVAPTQAPALAELNQRWVGQPWKAYAETHGKPQRTTSLPEGGQLITYLHARTETGPRPAKEVVNLKTGERSMVAPGMDSDTVRQQVSHNMADTSMRQAAPAQFRYHCTTTIRVNPQGLIEKIEQIGNDCP